MYQVNTPYIALRGAEAGEMNNGVLKSKWSLYTKFKDTSRAEYQWMVGIDGCVTDSGQWADIFTCLFSFPRFLSQRKR